MSSVSRCPPQGIARPRLEGLASRDRYRDQWVGAPSVRMAPFLYVMATPLRRRVGNPWRGSTEPSEHAGVPGSVGRPGGESAGRVDRRRGQNRVVATVKDVTGAKVGVSPSMTRPRRCTLDNECSSVEVDKNRDLRATLLAIGVWLTSTAASRCSPDCRPVGDESPSLCCRDGPPRVLGEAHPPARHRTREAAPTQALTRPKCSAFGR